MNAVIRSDVGRVRSVNEDRAVVRKISSGITLAILTDGMGGHQAGDTASQIAVDFVSKELDGASSEMTDKEWEALIASSIERANSEIYKQASLHSQLNGMGTTIIVALAAADRLTIANIGDSRAYLLSQGEFSQQTEDHSLVNELIRSGQISAEEAFAHPHRNVVTRALGTELSVRADIRHIRWNSGDILLLCSDGLTDMLKEADIAQLLAQSQTVEWKADQLVSSALEAGGEDNITVVLVEHTPDEHAGRESE